MSLPNIHIIIPVWGTKYIDLFTDFVIPTLIETNDISIFRECRKFVFEIYTCPEDELYLRSNENFQKLQNALHGWGELNLPLIEENPIKNPYHTMSYCHLESIQKANENDAAMIFLQPDALVGDGTFATIKQQLQDGKRIILAPGLRGDLESVTAIIKNREAAARPALSNRELVAYAIENLHHLSRSLLWGQSNINSFCSHIYWLIDDKNLYARCAHMHPLVVYPRDKNCSFAHTIDWDYFDRAVPDTNEWFVAENSDQVCLIELSNKDKFEGEITYAPASYMSLARFFWRAASPAHINLMTKPFLFQSRELSPGEWELQHHEADQLVNAAIKETKRSFISKVINDPSYFVSAVARIMNFINYHLENLKRNKPIVGSGMYYTYRACFLTMRAGYRLARKIKELAGSQSAVKQSG